MLIECACCKKETEHQHLHNCAHGIPDLEKTHYETTYDRMQRLESQLAEARAENERLKRIVSSTERWEKLDGQLQQARQEAAKWVADLLFSPEWEKECHCCEDYYCSICRIKDEFKLEG